MENFDWHYIFTLTFSYLLESERDLLTTVNFLFSFEFQVAKQKQSKITLRAIIYDCVVSTFNMLTPYRIELVHLL